MSEEKPKDKQNQWSSLKLSIFTPLWSSPQPQPQPQHLQQCETWLHSSPGSYKGAREVHLYKMASKMVKNEYE